MPKVAYTLEATILYDRIHPMFVGKDRLVSRTLRIGGEYSLGALHHLLFKAFDRHDEHLYEFQIGGKRPMDRDAVSFQPPIPGENHEIQLPAESPLPENAVLTRIDSLQLEVGDRFFYWFDFGDDWWHEIKVVNIVSVMAKEAKPTILARVGESPPQYPDFQQ